MLYDYTLNPADHATVDTESQDFINRAVYVQTNSGAKTYNIVEQTVWGPVADGNGGIVPGEISKHTLCTVIYEDNVGLQFGVDAYLLSKSPDVALTDVCAGLGVPRPPVQYSDPLPEGTDPIGEAWPAKGSNIYHVSAVFMDNPNAFPEGSYYTKKIDGRDTKLQRTKVRGTANTSGSPFNPVSMLPAWIVVG